MGLFGTHVLTPGGAVRFAFGAAEGTFEVRPGEWRITHRYTEEQDREGFEPLAPDAPQAPHPDDTVLRIATSAADSTIVVRPTLPDGDVVMRTEPALLVLPGSTALVHVGTPLGLAARTSQGQVVLELSGVRLEKTWFGPNVRDGEVCLAMRSNARARLAELPRRPHRAVTLLTVRNAGTAPFQLERLRLPVRYLGLHHDASGRWWTEGVEVVVRAGEAAQLSVGTVPQVAGPVEMVVPPRRPGAPNPVLRALDALFSERW